MSNIDTYFCFCCLSTSDLFTLFTCNNGTTYAALLYEVFSIQPFHEEDDGYICLECCKTLKEVHQFKIKILDTLNILQINGLIEVQKEKDVKYYIRKADLDLKNDLPDLKIKDQLKNTCEKDIADVHEDTKLGNTAIKLEEIDNNEIKHIPVKNCDRLTQADVENEKESSTKQINKLEVQYEVTNDLKCKVCSVILPNLYMYHTHMNEHYPNHICDKCGKGFVTEKRLKRHLPSHKKGPFKCQECDKEFSNYNTLSSHRQRKHGNVQAYKCPQCDERFETSTRRALHLTDVHSQSVGNYPCTICKRTFLLAGNLSTHMRYKHMKVKRHFCHHCNAGFFHKQELKSHIVSHIGAKEFQCTLCPNRYRRKKALDVHMKKHTGDKRFCCEICGKKFIQKSTLLTHIKIHNRVAIDDV